MNLQEIYTKLKLTEDSLIRVSADKNWQKKVALPSRIYRLLEKNDLLKTLDAFFCFDNKPLILFFNFENSNRKQELHKAIWNFNESPIAIIVENNAVEIFNGFSIDENTKLLHSIGGVEKLDDFTYFELVTGKTWEKYQKDLSHKNRVDYKLLENIEAAQGLMMNLGLSQTLVNALIGKIIFYRYLIDRKVKLNYQGKERWDNRDLCECLANKDSFFAFVRHLENKETGFNGDMFRITPKDYQHISQDALNVLIRLLESENLATGQRSLFDIYDFSILPIEFISNMYEKFIGVDKQNKESAYYTPTFLVDYIIAETVEKHLSADDNYNCRILDPSCGSGIFLVESLRRIIEKYVKVKKIKNTNSESFREGLKKLVCDNIFGIDKDYDAIQVAIFSIYLTLLDYQEPADIEKFKFPNLFGKNLICSDTFDVDNPELKDLEERKLQFDYIIGNPPWKRGGVKRGSCCEKYLKQRGLLNDVGNRELAQAFVLRSMDYTSPNTQCALVLVSKVLYNLDSKKFRSFILDHLYINQVLELAPVRKEVFNKSNDPAVAPACVLFYKNANGESTDSNVINHIALKPSRFFTMFKVFSLTRNDIQEIQQDRLKKYDYLWKVLVYGSYLDFVFIKRLKELPNISEIPGFIFPKHGIKAKDGDKKVDVSVLYDWHYTKPSNVYKYFVVNDDEKWKQKEVGFARKKKGCNEIDIDMYRGPILLVKKGTSSELTKTAAISYEDTIYNDTFAGIKISTTNQTPILRNILGLFNSTFFAYFNLLTFSSSGIEREQSFDEENVKFPYCDGFDSEVETIEYLTRKFHEQTMVDHVLKNQIDLQIASLESSILEKLNCSDTEKDLIDYAKQISIPLATKSRGYEKVFYEIKPNDSLLLDYAQVYIDRYAKSFNRNGKRFMADIHYSEQMIGMFFKVIDEKDFTEEIHVSRTDNNLLALATKLSSQRITDRLFVQKDIRGFEKEFFYIFKPNEKRLWHKAIAHWDVDEFDNAMLRAGRNSQ
ncbi:MAG: N-6 DNA methylase [Bacteroidales bacterium]|nr:N-6 DNA methylase [Bacteroidales bacterium]